MQTMIHLLIAFAFGYAGAFATVAGWVIYQSIQIDRDQNREAYNDAKSRPPLAPLAHKSRPRFPNARDPRQAL